MSAFQVAKQSLINSLLSLGKIAEQLGDPLVAQACGRELLRLDDGRLLIVVCGEFKSGKSTLINTLLGATGLTPTDFDIATSTAILIKHGDEQRAYVVPADGEEAKPIKVSDIAKYASEGGRKVGAATPRAVLIETPSPFLDGGLTLVDTPGIGSLNRSHTEITFTVVADADLVLFASDAQSPLTTHELKFLAERVLPINQSVTLIQTKSDSQPALDSIVSANMRKLRDLAGRDFTILPASSLLYERYTKTRDPADLTESGFEALQDHVAATLRAGGERRILSRAIRSASESVEKLLSPRRAELLAIRERGSPAFQAAKDELVRTRQHMETLQRDHHIWIGHIAEGFDAITERTIRGSLAKRLTELDYALQDAAERADASPGAVNSLASKLEDDLKFAFLSTCKDIVDQVDALRNTVAGRCKLELKAIVREPQLEMRPLPTVESRSNRGFWRNTLDWGGHYRRDVFGGLTVGAVAGGVIGGVVGMLGGPLTAVAGAQLGASLGTLISGIGGIFSATAAVNNRAKDEVRRIIERDLMRYLRQAGKECTDACLILANEMRHDLGRDFNVRIADYLTDARQKEEALNRGLATAKEAMEARIAQLTAEIVSVESEFVSARAAYTTFENHREQPR